MDADNTRWMDLKSLLFGALVLAVVVNVAQFWTVNARATKNYRSFARYANADLVDIGKRQALFRSRHARGLAFGEAVAPGARIILPTDRELADDELPQQLLSFGKAASVRRVDYDPEHLGKRVDVGKHVIAKARSKLRHRPRFAVVSRSREAAEFVLARRGKTDVLVNTALLPADVQERLAAP